MNTYLNEKDFSLERISRTRNFDANLKLRHHKLHLMARFMEIESSNPKKKQNEMAKELKYSGSTLQRYRQDKKNAKSL